MRIIKLSNKDYEMRTEKDVQLFFEKVLHHKSPPGRFECTKRFKKDLYKGEKLVFTYRTPPDLSRLVYLGYAASEIFDNTESNKDDYPVFFLVDVHVGRICRAQGTLQDLQAKLLEEGIEKISGQAWITLEDSPELDKIWESFKAPKQADISAGC